MLRKKFSMNFLSLGFLFISSASIASSIPLFSDNYSTFQLGSTPVSSSVGLGCNQTPGGTPSNTLHFTFPQPAVGNWSMLVSPDYQNHLTWSGTAATQSWAYNPSVGALYFHAALNWSSSQPAAYDQGFAFLSNTNFDSTQYLSIQESIAYDTCQQTGSGASCQVGPALINSESNYRAVYLSGQSGSSSINVMRYAPCDSQQLYYADGSTVTTPILEQMTIRIDYLGASTEPTPGGWNYYVNGKQAYLKSTLPNLFNGSVPTPSEPSTYLQAALIPATGPTRLGTYMTVNGSQSADMSYIEGRLFSASAYEFNAIPASAISFTASNLNSSGQVIAGTMPSLSGWSSGGFDPAWIQLDLGATESVKKIRLLTSQTPSGATTHVITGSNSITAAGALYSPITLGTISANTVDDQWLNLEFPAWQGVRYIRITTTKSPSWVGWRQLQIYD
jgi:hypothetical protein